VTHTNDNPHDAGATAEAAAPAAHRSYPVTTPSPTIPSARAHELVAAGATLVDVRSDAEYAAGHLPNAIHIPVELCWRRYGEIPPGAVVVYSNEGDNRSPRARRILNAFGRETYDMGGMRNW
jgi:rhodanese-related sulfurtransferase